MQDLNEHRRAAQAAAAVSPSLKVELTLADVVAEVAALRKQVAEIRALLAGLPLERLEAAEPQDVRWGRRIPAARLKRGQGAALAAIARAVASF